MDILIKNAWMDMAAMKRRKNRSPEVDDNADVALLEILVPRNAAYGGLPKNITLTNSFRSIYYS